MQQLTIDGRAGWGKTSDFWDEIPDFGNAVTLPGNALPENPDFATFPAKTPPAPFQIPGPEELRPVRYDTELETDGDTVTMRQVITLSDGSQKRRVLGVVNPKTVYVRKYREDLYKVLLYPDIPDVEMYRLMSGEYERRKKTTEEDIAYLRALEIEKARLAHTEKRMIWRNGKAELENVLTVSESQLESLVKAKHPGYFPAPLGDTGRYVPNLVRARTQIEQLGLCNDWKYFVTLTLDGEKLSRNDLEGFRAKLNQLIRNLRRNHDTQIDYLFVPEPHPTALKSGRLEWHLHGLMNLPEGFLEPFCNKAIYGRDKNKRPPRYIQDLLRKGLGVWHWKHADSAFGHNVFELVTSRDAATRYLLKYVSKTQMQTAAQLSKGQHLYYASRGLRKAEKMPPETLTQLQAANARVWQRFGSDCLVKWFKLD